MSTIKTLVNESSVTDFIDKNTEGVKKEDSYKLLEIFNKVTGEKPKMWGTSMIGYGMYHYKSERSSQEGDWPLTAFSPRKQSLTLYIMLDFDEYSDLFDKLGKYKTSKACLYINKLADVDLQILEELVKISYENAKKKYNAE